MGKKIDAGTLRSVLIPAAIGLLCLAVFVVLGARLSALSFPGALDAQPGFSYETAYQQIDVYTEAMKSLYFVFQVTDVVFLLAYGFLFARVVSLAARELCGKKTRLTWFALVPVAAAACDFLEDAGIFTMIRLYPQPFPTLAALTSGVGLPKLWLFWASFGIAVFGGIAALAVKKNRNEKAMNGFKQFTL